MTIQIITGNIWNSKAQTIVNTVNCEGVMGAGIALECRLRFPEMFSKYKEICEKGLLEPGLLLLHKNDQRWILNFPTKTLWKLPSKEEYLHTGLIKFKNTFKEKGILGCFRTPELANNVAIQNLWKHFDPVVHKRRCTFLKNL